MGAQIAVYINGQRMAITNMAFALTAKYELMRERVLQFSVPNTDNARKYIIDPNAVYEYKGQKYDMKSYKQVSGANNTTSALGWHVLLHAKNYTIPAGYSFVGTLQTIIADMLSVSGGNAEFSVGTCADIGTNSFSLGNAQPIDLYSALYALPKLGCEISYDNFTINAPERIGADTGKIFKFGRDLCSLERNYDKTTNPTTVSYAITIANLQRLPGGSPGDEFALGDTVGILDSLIGDSITSQRIVTYEEHDNPALDKVIIGQWVSNLEDTVSTMQVDIVEAQKTADGSVHVGESYNGVDISHEFGFKSTSADGLYRKFDNGTDGYVIQEYYWGEWVTVWQTETATGKTIAYNREHTQKVELGGDTGFTTWTSYDWGATWEQTGGMNAEGKILAGEIGDIVGGATATIGSFTGETGTYPCLQLKDSIGIVFLTIAKVNDKLVFSRSGNYTGNFLGVSSSGPTFLSGASSVGFTGTVSTGYKPVFVNGICTGFTT